MCDFVTSVQGCQAKHSRKAIMGFRNYSIFLTTSPICPALSMRKTIVQYCACLPLVPAAMPLLSSFPADHQACEASPELPWTWTFWALSSRCLGKEKLLERIISHEGHPAEPALSDRTFLTVVHFEHLKASDTSSSSAQAVETLGRLLILLQVCKNVSSTTSSNSLCFVLLYAPLLTWLQVLKQLTLPGTQRKLWKPDWRLHEQ